MEIWKEFFPSYEVSTLGNVRSLKHQSPKLLKLRTQQNGYLHARIVVNRREHIFLVHRLVANAFIPNPDGKPQVNHINGIKTDNHVENLEWVTASENIAHARQTGLINNPKGIQCSWAKLTEEQVLWVRSVYIPFDKKFGANALARLLNIKDSVIHSVVRGETYSTVGGQIHKKTSQKLPDHVRNQIRAEYQPNIYGRGSHALAKKFGVSKTTILRILRET